VKTKLLITIACVSAWAGLALAADQVNTIDARSFEAAGLTVSADKVEFTAADKKESLPIADVAELVLGKPGDAMAKPGQCVVITIDGIQLAATNVTMSGTKLKVESSLLGAVEFPLESLKVIFTPDAKLTPQQVAQRCEELKISNGQQDSLVIAKSESDWTSVEGTLKGIDAENVSFNWEDTDRSVARKGIRAIWAARLTKPQAAKAAIGTIVGFDGSSISVSSLTMDDKSLNVTVSGLGARTLNRTDVAVVRLISGRMVNLSDLKPAKVDEHGLLDTKFPYRVNRAVSGKELKLGGQAYSTGLGLHSFCELTYDLGGAYTTFVTIAGIDDAVRPAGDATVTFLGDGKELDKPLRLTGKDKPATIRLSVTGVKQLIIRVDFGTDKLDVSDHVDLAAARLIK
jgi:hypothetical protein